MFENILSFLEKCQILLLKFSESTSLISENTSRWKTICYVFAAIDSFLPAGIVPPPHPTPLGGGGGGEAVGHFSVSSPNTFCPFHPGRGVGGGLGKGWGREREREL